MNYLIWALVALAGYSVFTPLVKVAIRDTPSDVVALVANGILALSALGVVLYRDEQVVSHLTGESAPYIFAAGVFLSVGILAYYRALSAGPVSVVVPIFGMFLVVSSLLGVVFLGESFSLRKGAGIALAAVAVYLTVTG